MSLPEVMGLVTGLLQFIVAGYALRLNRIFGTARVGWSLFWAFALLALLHFVQSVASFNSGAPLGTEVEVIYSLISLLLLTGLIHIETLLKERRWIEQEEKRMRDGLELLVNDKTAHLTEAIKDLQLEIAERKRVEAALRASEENLNRAQAVAEIGSWHLDIGNNVLTFAALSFLGVGSSLGFADWGQLLSFARNWIPSLSTYWYIVVYPGIALLLFVLAWNLIGDAFRDALDPRMKNR